MNELALFAGAGGGILGGKLLGWRTVCAVERDAYAAQVLAQRQNDGILEPFPIWSDVTTFDGKPWRGIVDVISGGFPCQDISAAGKGAGITGARSGLWKEFARIIGEVEPGFVFVENSPMLTIRGLGTVLGDLASRGFDAEWGVLSAADVGAPHLRERCWVMAWNPNRINDEALGGVCRREATDASGVRTEMAYTHLQHDKRRPEPQQPTSVSGKAWNQPARCGNEIPHAHGTQCQGNQCPIRSIEERTNFGKPSWWKVEPDVGRVANDVAFGMDQLKAIGNGQVSLCAATAFNLLAERAGLK